MYKLLKTRIQICSVNGFPSMERGNGKRAGITPINLPIFYAAVEWKRIGINPASPFPQNHTRNRQRNFITYPPLQFHLLTGGDDGGENSAGASGGTQNTHIQLLVNRIVQPCQPVAGGTAEEAASSPRCCGQSDHSQSCTAVVTYSLWPGGATRSGVKLRWMHLMLMS